MKNLHASLTRFTTYAGLIMVAVLLQISAASAENGGRYLLPAQVDLLKDGETFKLSRAFTYVDPYGRVWRTPAGSEVNGASIPRVFWSLIGSPMVGKYRDASIIHDHYCVSKTRPWRDVHQVFYHAMLTSGVSKIKARLMYAAVNTFGPRWKPPRFRKECLKEDGKIDYSKCTENNAKIEQRTIFPELTKGTLEQFIKDNRKIISNRDIEILSKEASALSE